MRTYAFYYLLSIYKSFLERAKFKIFLFEMQMRMCTKQDSNSEYEDRYWPMLLWCRLSRREPKYFKSEVLKTEVSENRSIETWSIENRSIGNRSIKNRNGGTRKAKVETRKSKRESRNAKGENRNYFYLVRKCTLVWESKSEYQGLEVRRLFIL